MAARNDDEFDVRFEEHFRRRLFETEAGLRRTLSETQRQRATHASTAEIARREGSGLSLRSS